MSIEQDSPEQQRRAKGAISAINGGQDYPGATDVENYLWAAQALGYENAHPFIRTLFSRLSERLKDIYGKGFLHVVNTHSIKRHTRRQ